MPVRIPTRCNRKSLQMLLSLSAVTACTGVQALEVTAGDYEVFPANINIALLYLQHSTASDLMVNGVTVARHFKVTPDIGLARYIRTIEVAENAVYDLNVILPFGRIRAQENASALGGTDGAGDVILGGPVKFLLDAKSRDAFSIGPLVYVPTGSYDRTAPMNLGEHRWKGLLQMAYVTHFAGGWSLHSIADKLFYGKNSHFGAGMTTLKQKPRFEVQSHLRYDVSPQTAVSLGVGHYWGAERSIGGAAQGDKLKTTYGRLSAMHWLDQTTQLQIQLGKDLSVQNGVKESSRLNLRVAKIF